MVPKDDWLNPMELEDLGAFKFLILFIIMSSKLPWQFRLKSALLWATAWIMFLLRLPQLPTLTSIPLTVICFILFMYQGLRIFLMIGFCVQKMCTGEYTPAAF